MLARSSYYIASRVGVVFRQMCCCTELIGPSRASISYMAKFLATCTLYSRRDFQVFNYLSSYPCNQDFLCQRLSQLRRQHGRGVAQVCTIGLSINENIKLEKGKEKNSSAVRRFMRSSSHVSSRGHVYHNPRPP